jgi:hypothetical protein
VLRRFTLDLARAIALRIGTRQNGLDAMEDARLQKARAALLIAAFLAAAPAHANPESSAREAQCLENAARYYSLPLGLLRAIRRSEGGSTGGWRRNADGSLDYGVMQINSRWLPRLARAGYTAQVLVYDACASIAAGAWILAQALAEGGAWNRGDVDPSAYWRAVGNYHSRTPPRNRRYAERVWARYQIEVGR